MRRDIYGDTGLCSGKDGAFLLKKDWENGYSLISLLFQKNRKLPIFATVALQNGP